MAETTPYVPQVGDRVWVHGVLRRKLRARVISSTGLGLLPPDCRIAILDRKYRQLFPFLWNRIVGYSALTPIPKMSEETKAKLRSRPKQCKLCHLTADDLLVACDRVEESGDPAYRLAPVRGTHARLTYSTTQQVNALASRLPHLPCGLPAAHPIYRTAFHPAALLAVLRAAMIAKPERYIKKARRVQFPNKPTEDQK